MALDYFVNDRITISSNFSLTYTDNQKNSDDLLSVAYKKMPNMAIYDEDAYGRSLGTYYTQPRFEERYDGDDDELGAQRGLVNPVASAWPRTRSAVTRYSHSSTSNTDCWDWTKEPRS